MPRHVVVVEPAFVEWDEEVGARIAICEWQSGGGHLFPGRSCDAVSSSPTDFTFASGTTEPTYARATRCGHGRGLQHPSQCRRRSSSLLLGVVSCLQARMWTEVKSRDWGRWVLAERFRLRRKLVALQLLHATSKRRVYLSDHCAAPPTGTLTHMADSVPNLEEVHTSYDVALNSQSSFP